MDELADILAVYDDHPMSDGDAVLLLDQKVALEVEGLADNWCAELREGIAQAVRAHSRSVQLAVARPQRVLRPGDHALWADLREELLGDGVEVLPVFALNAA